MSIRTIDSMTPSRFRHRTRPEGQLTVDELADQISRHGLAASERELEQFARRIAASGDTPGLASIMLDRSAPAIVRERAFARTALVVRGSAWPLVHVA